MPALTSQKMEEFGSRCGRVWLEKEISRTKYNCNVIVAGPDGRDMMMKFEAWQSSFIAPLTFSDNITMIAKVL